MNQKTDDQLLDLLRRTAPDDNSLTSLREASRELISRTDPEIAVPRERFELPWSAHASRPRIGTPGGGAGPP